MKSIFKQVLAVFTALTLMLPATGIGFAEEAGEIPLSSADIVLESGKTYTISNADELYNFAEIVNQATGLTGDGAIVKLKNDITLNEGTFSAYTTGGSCTPLYNGEAAAAADGIRTWTPIGTMNGGMFCGTFEGQNKTISGLYVNAPSGEPAGLFGNCGGIIHSVRLTNSYISGPCAGGIVGVQYGKLIYDSSSTAIVNGEYVSGGIAGFLTSRKTEEYKVNLASLQECRNAGRVYGSNAGALAGGTTESSNRLRDCTDSGFVNDVENSSVMMGSDDFTDIFDKYYMSGTGADQNGYIYYRGAEAELNKQATTAAGNLYIKHYANEYVYLPKGCSAVYDITPAEFCTITSIDAGTASVTAMGNNRYLVKSTGDDVAIKVNFKAQYFNCDIDTINGKYCDVDETGINVYKVTPKDGYYIEKVIINGVSAGSISEIRITEDSKVEIYMARNGQTWEETQESDRAESTAKANAKIIAGIEATTIKASTAKTSTGKIKIKWTKSAGYKVDYYEVYRSTSKSKVTNGKAFFTTKTGSAKSYTNSKSLKKGTRYYYKVRGVRVVDGVKYYTKWSNLAYRKATKTFK